MTRDEIANRLQRWHDEAERLIGLFDLKGQCVEVKDQPAAKLLFNSLKDELQAEHKRLSPMKAQESLSPDEAAFYRPVVHEAFIALSRAKRNSTPDARWLELSTTC